MVIRTRYIVVEETESQLDIMLGREKPFEFRVKSYFNSTREGDFTFLPHLHPPPPTTIHHYSTNINK